MHTPAWIARRREAIARIAIVVIVISLAITLAGSIPMSIRYAAVASWLIATVVLGLELMADDPEKDPANQTLPNE